MLQETGREGITGAALDDGSSFICRCVTMRVKQALGLFWLVSRACWCHQLTLPLHSGLYMMRWQPLATDEATSMSECCHAFYPICRSCGGVVSRSREAAHREHWCSGAIGS